MLAELMDELSALEERIKGFDRHIDAVFQSNEACQPHPGLLAAFDAIATPDFRHCVSVVGEFLDSL